MLSEEFKRDERWGRGEGDFYGVYEEHRGLGKVLRHFKEIKEEHDECVKRYDDEKENGNMTQNEYVPEGIAKKCIDQMTRSKELRNAIGWSDDRYVESETFEKQECENDVKVILEHEDAHRRLLEETRELIGSFEETMERCRRER